MLPSYAKVVQDREPVRLHSPTLTHIRLSDVHQLDVDMIGPIYGIATETGCQIQGSAARTARTVLRWPDSRCSCPVNDPRKH